MTTEAILSIVEERSIQNLGYRAAVLLDEEKLEEWLKLFAEESEYELRAYSPEIGRWMTWWKSGSSKPNQTIERSESTRA